MQYSQETPIRRFDSVYLNRTWRRVVTTMALRLSAVFSICFLSASTASFAQITNVTNDQAVPTPGAGHDYIGTLNEIVNPSNGSLSLRIPIPAPAGRGITLPLTFSYDSSGIIQMGSDEVITLVTGSNNSYMYTPKLGVGPHTDGGILEKGGWGLGLPSLSAELLNYPGNNTYGATCPLATGFVFSDSAGTRHAMNLALPDSTQCQSAGGVVAGYPYSFNASAYDGSYAAWTNAASNPGVNDIQDMPFFVTGNDGTYYYFPNLLPGGEFPEGGCTGTMNCNLASYIEDRNGNMIHINSSTGSTAPLPVNIVDTAGRTQVTIPTFGSSTGDQIAVSGLSQPYVVNWETVPYNFSVPVTDLNGGAPGCVVATTQSTSGTMLVVKSIQLPNGQAYQFQYDPNYGLLNKIIYPSGGYVQYTWGPSTQPSDSILYPFISENSVGLNGCLATYNAPAILTRTVSYDGVTKAQQQSFTYGTTGFSTTYLGQWTGKTTAVTTTDDVRNQTFQTQYSYSPMSVAPTPDTVAIVAGQVPVESAITYGDFNGKTLKTVTKFWAGSGNNPLL